MTAKRLQEFLLATSAADRHRERAAGAQRTLLPPMRANAAFLCTATAILCVAASAAGAKAKR
jgi:hypothetical protein